MRDSGQQWDFPNGWPPLQQLIIVGLENTGDERARRLAFDLAQKWIANNYDAYQDAVPRFDSLVLPCSFVCLCFVSYSIITRPLCIFMEKNYLVIVSFIINVLVCDFVPQVS